MKPETDEDTTTIVPADEVKARLIIQKIQEHKTLSQIASELGISRNTLYSIMNRPGVGNLLTTEIREWETAQMRNIEELANSTNPQNKRHAVTERGKMIRHAQDKLYPTLFASKNLTLSATIDGMKTQQEMDDEQFLKQQIFNKALEKLPPDLIRIILTAITYADHETRKLHKLPTKEPEGYHPNYQGGYQYRKKIRQELKNQINAANHPHYRIPGDTEFTENAATWKQNADQDEKDNWPNLETQTP